MRTKILISRTHDLRLSWKIGSTGQEIELDKEIGLNIEIQLSSSWIE